MSPSQPDKAASVDLRDQLQAALGTTYALERELGGGGMSRVFLATETALDRRVVIKLLPPELAHAVSADRFRQEIRLVARLQHPHIVPLLSAGEAGGLLFYTMPFVEGESLRARITRSGELAVRDAVRVLRDVAAALDYAHELGLVHRDIKPDNVLLARGEALVTDFGVAKALSASAAADTGLTSIGVALGTPAYMAPEQAAADPHVDHRADIYGFGCMAYECLCGLPPFSGRPTANLLAAHLSEAPERLERRRTGLPPALTSLVMRCLEKRPADRPQRAAELLATLEDQLATPSGGSPPTVRVETRSRPRRAPVIAAAAIAAVLLAGIAVLKARAAPRVTPSAAVIAIMPLTPAAPDTALARLGRDLAVTLSANLDGVGEIRTVDPLTVLAQVKGDAAPSLREAADLSLRLGARSVLQGTLVGSGRKVRADLGLYTTDSAARIARVTVTGGLEDVAGLTDSITWAVLRQVWRTRGTPTPSLAAVTTHSVPALRAFLEGERAITEGRFRRAEEAFGRAIEADSSFWLAYRRYEFARSWGFRPVDSVIYARFRANRQALPERERLLIEALMADSLGDRGARLVELIRRHPDFWPAWWEYADEYLVHRGGLLGSTHREAQGAIEKVIDLNPDLTGAWDHLLWMGIRNRDTAATRRALAADARVHIDSLWLEGGSHYFTALRLAAYHFIAPDSAAALSDSLLRAIPTSDQSGDVVGAALVIFGFPRAQVEYSRRALERPLDPAGVTGHLRLIPLAWAARGDWDAALAAADEYVSHELAIEAGLFRYQLAVTAAWLGAIEADRAARLRPAEVRDTAGAPAEVAWLDGILATAKGDGPALERAREALRGARDAAAPDLDRSLAAFGLALRGERSRAAGELARLERERAQLLRDGNDHPFLAGIDRLAASRWLAAAGDTARSLSLLRWHETVLAPNYRWIAMNAVLAGPALLEQARLREGQGQVAEARRAYTRFLEWYDAPMASQRHLVEEARAALARLSGVREIPADSLAPSADTP